MLKRFVTALVLVLAPMSPAHADQAPSEAAEMAAYRAFGDWVQRVTTLLEEASRAGDAFNEFNASFDPNRDPRQQMAMLNAVRAHARESRALMARVESDLRAAGTFTAPGAPSELIALANALHGDSITFVRNMDGVLGLMVEAVDAIERNDQPALQRIGPQLIRSAAVLIDGQIVMLRARQQMLPPSESAYHSLGAMTALYEGMSSLLMPDVPNRAEALRTASRNAAQWGRSGRAAVTSQRAELTPLSGRERDLVSRMLDLEDQFYAENDRVVSTLENAARAVQSGTDGPALNQSFMPTLAQIEMRYQQLSQQQIALYQQMVQ